MQNDSFFDALNIIKDNNFILISGIPGIGKTTLARILVYHYLARGMDEFIYISDNVSEGFRVYRSVSV